ncbi:restriction endonuclease subunit S [Flavobacterium azooxidireducens]|uniref:Restriction endonuclease subunit S n=1 Tax=Flavobacterium azooxidireducens TaxID=1871076 RepID=A0ABY4KD16_9FLAO|nr:restriction endonuclease subunit S [Flavobacterium azooxidireducens]UPQ78206.1 restriction endonuclease subunit S [Flavobacterium azooxidireducens]
MPSSYKRLGEYIQPVAGRNKDLENLPLVGLSITKKFIPSIANTIGTDMSTYRVIERNQFAYGPVTSRNGDKITIALFDDFDKALISQAYIPFEVKDEKELNPEYLMMWFRRPEFDRYARFKSHGSAREIFDWNEMCAVELPIPSIKKQLEIVREYHTIQNRIALNNQLISKLEETAQAIYKEWFVDFEFPDENGKPYKSNGGKMVGCEELEKEIPEGWEVVNLDEMIEVKYGKDYKHLQKGNIPLYGSGGVMGYVDKVLYDQTTILIPRKGSLNNILFLNKPFWSVDTMFYSILKNEYNGCYIYFFLTAMDFNSLNVGSAVPSMTTNYLNNMKIIKPSANVLKKFDKLIRKLFSQIEFKKNQNQKLEELKYLLLAKMTRVESEKEIA